MTMIIGNELGRLDSYGSTAPATAQIPMYDTATGEASSLTVTEIVSAVEVAGPGSSTDTGIVIFNGTGGKTIANSGSYAATIKRSSAQKDSITTVLADVTGLTAMTLVAGATYRFRCVLPGTADGTSGIKYAFKYTTATLTSIEATGSGYTASAVAVQHTTTTTDATLLFDQGAAVILVELQGTMVVNAGGTVAVQIGTHTGTTTCSCYVGATMDFVRIA